VRAEGHDPNGRRELTGWLGAMEEAHSLVVFITDGENTTWTKRCVRQADIILVVANAAGEPFVRHSFHTCNDQVSSRPDTLSWWHSRMSCSPVILEARVATLLLYSSAWLVLCMVRAAPSPCNIELCLTACSVRRVVISVALSDPVGCGLGLVVAVVGEAGLEP
jgi:hypothetical protein